VFQLAGPLVSKQQTTFCCTSTTVPTLAQSLCLQNLYKISAWASSLPTPSACHVPSNVHATTPHTPSNTPLTADTAKRKGSRWPDLSDD